MYRCVDILFLLQCRSIGLFVGAPVVILRPSHGNGGRWDWEGFPEISAAWRFYTPLLMIIVLIFFFVN